MLWSLDRGVFVGALEYQLSERQNILEWESCTGVEGNKPLDLPRPFKSLIT